MVLVEKNWSDTLLKNNDELEKKIELFKQIRKDIDQLELLSNSLEQTIIEEMELKQINKYKGVYIKNNKYTNTFSMSVLEDIIKDMPKGAIHVRVDTEKTYENLSYIMQDVLAKKIVNQIERKQEKESEYQRKLGIKI